MRHDTPRTPLSPGGQRLFTRWQTHLSERGVLLAGTKDFLAFGSLSKLERLQKALVEVDPAQANAMRLALKQRRSERWQRSQGTTAPGNRDQNVDLLSVPEGALPRFWRRELRAMRKLRVDVDAGRLSLDDRRPPSEKVIRNLASTLRIFAGVCIASGNAIELTAETVPLWLQARLERGNKHRTIASRLKDLILFATWCDEEEETLEFLHTQKRRYRRSGNKEAKAKDIKMRRLNFDLADVWLKAEELRAEAQLTSRGSAKRARLTRAAACVALSVVCPLRIGDLHRIAFGEHLQRRAGHWSLSIETAKTGLAYDRPVLWPELTPFLDDLLLLDMPHDNIWDSFVQKDGLPIFSRDGASGVAVDWPTRCWERHFGIGEHIVRSLWHTMMYESDDEDQWIALALCGQGHRRTAQDYTLEGRTRRAGRRGRAKISEARRAALVEHIA